MDWFDGAIDEVAVDHRVLTPAEIHRHYRAGMGITGIELDSFGGPADLDLEGDFVYAVNAGGPGRPVQGVGFGRDDSAGVSVTAQNVASPWGTRPEFGPTANDNTLEEVMHSIRWSANPNDVKVVLDVVPGNTYNLQLLFAENWHSAPGTRAFDINVEGQRNVGEFDAVAVGGGQSKGAVYTQTLVAATNQLSIALTPSKVTPDKNPIINAFTLEFVEGAVMPETVLRDHPRISLRLGEPAGAAVAVDSSAIGGSQDGTYQGNPTLGVTGIPGNAGEGNTAARFDGVDDFVRVPDTAQPTAYTIEAWVKADPGATTSRNILVRTSDAGPHVHYSHQLRITAGGEFQHYTYDGALRQVPVPGTQSSTAVEAGQWYHVVGVYQPGPAGSMDLYVNGVKEGFWTGSSSEAHM